MTAPATRRATRFEWALVAVWTLGFAWALALDDPRLRFPWFVASLGIAQAAWCLGLFRARGSLWPIAVAAAVVRLWALSSPPAFSEDVFRYIYEGTVVWWTDLGFPFRVSPAEAPRTGLPSELFDESWLRINHPEIPTIYPPLAQAIFAGSAGLAQLFGLSALAVLKATLASIELGTLVILGRVRSWRRTLVWGWWASPLVIWATAREGHVDVVSACGLALGVAAFLQGRNRWGHVGFALAALAKLNGLVALVASVRRAPRSSGWGLALASLAALPFVFAPDASSSGLGQYAQRWRSGDGAFSIVLGVARWMLGGDYRDFGSAAVTQHQLARMMTVGIWVSLAVVRLRRPKPPSDIPKDAAFLLLTLLLLSPTLHPWYGVWLIPFLALPSCGTLVIPIMVMMTGLPLLHYPGWAELRTGLWQESPGVRGLLHGATWMALLASTLSAARQRTVDDPAAHP